MGQIGAGFLAMGLSQGPAPMAESPLLLLYHSHPHWTPKPSRSCTALFTTLPFAPGGLEGTWESGVGAEEVALVDPLCCYHLLPVSGSSAEGTQKFPKKDQRGPEPRSRIPQDLGQGPGLGRILPTSAGKGGFRRGLPCLPSMDSMSAVSSPQIYAPAPRTTNTSKS